MTDVHLLRPVGCLDGENGRLLRCRIGDLIAREARHVVIDCSGVQFMDSRGFGCLVMAFKEVRNSGNQLVVCGLSSQLRGLLELTGTEALLPQFATYADAQRHLAGDTGADRAGADDRK